MPLRLRGSQDVRGNARDTGPESTCEGPHNVAPDFPEGAGKAAFAFFDFSVGHLPQEHVVAAAARISCCRPTTASMQVLQRPIDLES